MAKIKQAVFDAGPLIHLQQTNALRALRLFERILITPGVSNEVRANFPKPANCKIVELEGQAKDFAKMVSERFELGIGEASSIALAKQQSIKLFFTDDLSARDAAKSVGLEPHGTLAIITRAFRESVLNEKEANTLLDELHRTSTLYVTKDLVEWAKKQIAYYRKQRA